MPPVEPKATRMSTAGRSIRRRREGFTLFELLIVITILAVMTGLVAPHLDLSVGEGDVTGTVRQVQAALNEGRTLAKLQRRAVEIAFDTEHVRVGEDGREQSFADDVVFRSIEFAGNEGESRNTLRINRRGITSTAILRFEIDGQLYSILVNPVVRQLEYGKGTKNFTDFAD